MSLPFAAKAGLGMAAAGGTGVAGWQVASYMNAKETVSSYLTQKKRKMASSEASWKKLHEFYKAESSNAISGLDKNKISHSDIEQWCSKKASKLAYEVSESDLLLIESWCSEPKTILEQLSAIGKRKLSTESSSNGDQSVWTSNVSAYKAGKGDNYKIQQNSSNAWTDIEKNNATEELMKKWCQAQETKHFKHEKDTLFETYNQWCITDIAGSSGV
ncbi:hypothetical protein HF1_07920 [Mycoplasma haemofelis str. Langford 1]|uniref:Uncharacterized protein n=1 Tax=Mycoplasma haemofelis (strain Langford 1) TaxID=941640 RepID=E8ZI29_MYCHL|nr:hypothetical protein [Mycoplasma haemofelis]CBY92800.1 hypothetical protein HF1_07920 [Mycoplasma haemofelis str. Langford 1]